MHTNTNICMSRNVSKAKIDNCNQYITKSKNTDNVDYPYIGYFSPKGEISLTRYDDTGPPRFVFLHIKIINSNTIPFNDSAQESTFSMTAYDSSKFFIKTDDGRYWYYLL